MARSRRSRKAQILWCDPKYMDEFVKELKTAGSFLDVVAAGGCDFNLGPIPVRFSLLMKLVQRSCSSDGRSVVGASRWNARRRGGARRADSVSSCAGAACRRLSGFREATAPRGQPASPIEWEALNDIASRHFQQLGISDKRVGVNLGSPDGPLPSVVATHFEGVIKKATHDASLFRPDVERPRAGSSVAARARRRAARTPDAEGSRWLRRAGEQGSRRGEPGRPIRRRSPRTSKLRAWVFGKILNWSVEHDVLIAAGQTDRDDEGLCSPTLSLDSFFCCSSFSR